jgi:hypothetical protein
MVKKLTAISIENAKPRMKDGEFVRTEIPDAVKPGLYLVLQPSGRKSWAVRCRLQRRPEHQQREHELSCLIKAVRSESSPRVVYSANSWLLQISSRSLIFRENCAAKSG